MSLIRPAAVAVALSALAFLPALPGAGPSQARASAGPSNLPFRGCGQSLTTSDWAQGHIIRNSSCTILENATRGWQQPPVQSSNHGTIARGSGLALYAQSIANSAGRGAWMVRRLSSDPASRDCTGSWTSTCIGSGRQGRSPFVGWGSVVRPQEWSGSVCTAARGSTTWCRSTAKYRFATAGQLGLKNTPVLQKEVLERAGSNAAMQVVSRGNDVPTCTAARLAYVICTAPAAGAARAAGTRENRVDRVVVTNRLVTVQINNNVDQRLNLTGSNFGTWARDPRAEYRTDARLANGEKNNSTSLAPYAAGIAGEAYWGAVLPATARSTATFAYTYADTVTDGRARTQFTGNRVTLTVQLNESGDNVGSTCVVFTPALRSQARCSGTGEGGVVQVTRSKTDSYVEINVGPS